MVAKGVRAEKATTAGSADVFPRRVDARRPERAAAAACPSHSVCVSSRRPRRENRFAVAASSSGRHQAVGCGRCRHQTVTVSGSRSIQPSRPRHLWFHLSKKDFPRFSHNLLQKSPIEIIQPPPRRSRQQQQGTYEFQLLLKLHWFMVSLSSFSSAHNIRFLSKSSPQVTF